MFIPLVMLAAVSSLRADGPRGVVTSTKPADELAACAALTMSRSRGYEVQTGADSNPREIKLVMRVLGAAAVVGVVSILDRDNEREISIFSTGKPTGAPAVITREVLRCASR